jgi:hypothetical protein
MIQQFSISSQTDYEKYLKRERKRLDEEHGVIKNINELNGWTLVSLERYKPGVIRFAARKFKEDGIEMRRGFGSDEVFDGLIVKS